MRAVDSEHLFSLGNLKNSQRVIQILFLLTSARHFKKPVGGENKKSPHLGNFILILQPFAQMT